MKKAWALILALVCLTTSFALAEQARGNAIAGSNAATLIEALENFGLEADGRSDAGKWEGECDDWQDARCSATVLSDEDGQIISATFEIRGKDVGLFDAVMNALDYDMANKAVAASYLKNAMKDKQDHETSFTIGDAAFTIRLTTATSVARIAINNWVSESKSTTKVYTMTVKYTSEIVELSDLLKVVQDVKVRAEADMGSKYLGTARKDELLTVLTPFYDENWHQVIYNGEVAYVWASYCELLQE